jgi:hypothetical protein
LAQELGDVPDPESPHQIEPMDLDGPHADPEMVGDFPVRQPFGD